MQLAADWLYDVEWQPTPLPEMVARPGTWVIFADHGGVGNTLAARMEQSGHSYGTGLRR